MVKKRINNRNQNTFGAQQNRGNVKSRLGINNRNMVATTKQQRTNIIKKFQTAGTKKELKLFTKHFDARTKIQSQSSNQQQQQMKQKINQGGIAKKAFTDLRSNNKKKPNLANQRKRTRPNSTTVQTNLNRESTFTGKSIKIVTKNDLVPKAREPIVKGKTLSITTSNNKKRNKKSSQSPVKTFKQNAEIIKEEYVTNKDLLPAKMIISNLHPNVTQDDIKELFGAVGSLTEARLKNLGTAEVIYSNAEDAFAAYNKYNTRNLDGQPMILKITTVEETSYRSAPLRPPPFYGQSSSSKSKFQNEPSFSGNASSTTTKPVVFTVRL